MAVTGVTMATPALANTGTSSQPAAAAPAINQVHKETGYFKTTDKLGTQLFYRKDIHQVVGTAHKENTGKKVFLLGHSMGGIAVHTVLRNHVSRNC